MESFKLSNTYISYKGETCPTEYIEIPYRGIELNFENTPDATGTIISSTFTGTSDRAFLIDAQGYITALKFLSFIIDKSTFKDNHGAVTLAIEKSSKSRNIVSVINSIFASNKVESVGGAINCNTVTRLNVVNSTFVGNYASWGGAIYANEAILTIIPVAHFSKIKANKEP